MRLKYCEKQMWRDGGSISQKVWVVQILCTMSLLVDGSWGERSCSDIAYWIFVHNDESVVKRIVEGHLRCI